MIKLPKLLNPETMKVERELHPLSLSLTLELIPASSAEMILPEGETVNFHDWVEIFTPQGSAGIFRVTYVETTAPGTTKVRLLHGISALGDAIIKGEGKYTGTLGELVTEILKHQTAKAGNKNLWQIGTIGYSGTSHVDYYDSNLFDVLVDSLEWFPWNKLEFDQSTLPWKINIIRLSSTPQSEGRFHRNIKTISIAVDGDELCTMAIADDRDKSLTADTASTYGTIKHILTIPDGATDAQVEEYLADYIDAHKNPTTTVDIDALQLFSVTGNDWDDLVTGRVHRCALPDYGITVSNKIVTIKYPDLMRDELLARVSLSNRLKNVADIIVDQERKQAQTSHTVGGYGRRITTVNEAYIDLYDEYTLFKGTTEETFAQVWIDLRAAEGELELMAKKTDLDGLETEVMILLDALDNKITLKADKIELQGYVTASELSAEIARIDNFFSGVSEISVLKATMVNCTGTFLYKGRATSLNTITVNTPDGEQSITYVGY